MPPHTQPATHQPNQPIQPTQQRIPHATTYATSHISTQPTHTRQQNQRHAYRHIHNAAISIDTCPSAQCQVRPHTTKSAMSDADHRQASTPYAAAGRQPSQSPAASKRSRQTIKPNPAQPPDHEPPLQPTPSQPPTPPTHRPTAVLGAYLIIGRNGADTSTECLSPITFGSLIILSTTAFLSFICEAFPQMIV